MIRPATVLSQKFKDGTFSGDGYFITGDDIALYEEAPTLTREVFARGSEVIYLAEQVTLNGGLTREYSERISHREQATVQLAGKINIAGDRVPQANEEVTLTAGFGRGGFGQLGFGGSITLNA